MFKKLIGLIAGNKIIIVVILTLLGVAAAYWNWSQEEIGSLREDLSEQKDLVQQEKDAREEVERARDERDRVARQQRNQISRLEGRIERIRQESTDLMRILDGTDLEGLASAKPEMIETRANEATREILEDLEAESKLIRTEINRREDDHDSQEDDDDA